MSVLRDAALILLALEGAVVALAILAVLGMVNYGLLRSRWWHVLSRWFTAAQRVLLLGRRIVARVCQGIAAPFFAIGAIQANLGVLAGGLLRQDRPEGPRRALPPREDAVRRTGK